MQIDRPVLDLAVNDGMKETELVSGKMVTVRLAEYRGGVFYNYVMISSAKVTKDGISYGNDLTAAGTASVTANNQLVLTALKLDGNKCTKAQTGNYSIELKYYRPDTSGGLVTISAGLQITDSQPAPAVVVKHTTAVVSCKTALDLVKDCLEVTGVKGEIISCEITGAEKEGGSYKLSTGESINIKTVTVQTEIILSDGKKIVMNREVAVGRTLKNA